MKLLWHRDMIRILGLKRSKDRSADVRTLIEGVRKHTNSAYKGVVNSTRPSRAAKNDQQVASTMSRQDAAAYWWNRIKGDV